MNILYFHIINIIFVSVIENSSIQAYNDKDHNYCLNRYSTYQFFFFRLTQKFNTEIMESFIDLCESFQK